MERTGLLQIAGKDVTVIGPDIKVGQQAPEFTAQAQDWSTVKVLDATRGKVRVIASLPSLATSVCDTETRRFNEAAASLDKDIAIITISNDLPYALKNWCAAAGVDKVMVVSDHMDNNFGEKYGVLVKERRILRRAVFVVDKQGKVVYVAYLPTLGDQPIYEEVLAAAKGALNS
ncbi:MAG: thiol peroxidase [Anaerolineales bacterium]